MPAGGADPPAMTFADHGAERFPAALDATAIAGVLAALGDLPPAHAGVRLRGIAALRHLLSPSGPVGAVAVSVVSEACRPVRALLFDKTADTNWALRWHQDRTISVAERIEVDGFGPWTVKSGMLHVAPPFEVLQRMVTLRVHLDPVPATNAPLLVAPRSHRLGRISERDVPRVVQQCGSAACLAEAGDVWLYATPVLHASDAARAPRHRRVLQIDYAAGNLPGGLRWLGV